MLFWSNSQRFFLLPGLGRSSVFDILNPHTVRWFANGELIRFGLNPLKAQADNPFAQAEADEAACVSWLASIWFPIQSTPARQKRNYSDDMI